MIQTFIFLMLTIIAAESYSASNNKETNHAPGATTSSANSASLQQPLDDEFKRVTTLAYNELAASSAYQLPQADLNALINEVTQADVTGNGQRVISLIIANVAILQKNINAKELQNLTALLLKYHAVGTAERIADLTASEGDTYAQAKQHFEFAKYEAALNHWDAAISGLKKINIANELSKDNGDEANIIYGAALQYKKKHREALTYYARVKQDSAFYPIAQLNSALAYIRQDWWTDAQLTIEQALPVATRDNIELANRLYTILGFSQLQQGYYRNARESFRNVKIKSIYANRALLGVGMAALNQEDFVGAINAFAQLKTHPENDMSVAQSYLLNAYSLAKIKQNDAASASYTEAINFYEQKTNFYDNLLSDIKNSTPSTQPLLISKINTAIEKQEPELSQLEVELKMLSSLSEKALSPNTLLLVNKLYSNMFSLYLNNATDVMTKNQATFNNYLNQSRFGLTKLYDSNN